MTSCAKSSSIQAGLSISSLLMIARPTKLARIIARVSRGTAASGFISGLCAESEDDLTPWRAQISRISSGSSSSRERVEVPDLAEQLPARVHHRLDMAG